MLSLVENSLYDHEELGRVRLVSVDEARDEVLLERTDRTARVTGLGKIPAGTRESIASFTERASPADISVTPPTVEIDAESVDIY